MTFPKPQNLFQVRINSILQQSKGNTMEQVLRLVPIILGLSSDNTDLVTLYRLVGVDVLAKLVSIFGGRHLKLPTSSELEETITLALCYHYREVEGLSWEEVKAALPIEINTLVLGLKIKSLSKQMRKEITTILMEAPL